jgi:chorismate mutase
MMESNRAYDLPLPELEVLRTRIDEIDAGLIDLIAARIALARKAVALREAHSLPREDLAREAAVVRRASALARERGVEPELTRDVFWRLLALSRWGTDPRVDPPSEGRSISRSLGLP